MIIRKTFLIPTLIMLMLSMPKVYCQEQTPGSHGLTLVGYGLYDFHYATGGIGGGALILDWQAAPSFKLGIGAEYASSNRISTRLNGEATLLTTKKMQRLTLENGYLWRHFPSLNLQEFTSSLQLGWHARHANLHLGLCNRYTAALVQRTDGGAGTIFEPMNVMLEQLQRLCDRACCQLVLQCQSIVPAAKQRDVCRRSGRTSGGVIEPYGQL